MIATINNKFTDKNTALKTLKEAEKKSGLYETLKTINKQAPTLSLHINRLFSSAKKLKYTKEELTNMTLAVIEKSKYKSQRIRITVTEDKTVITSTRFRNNPEIYKGVTCVSTMAKRTNPKIKSTNISISKKANAQAKKSGHFEAILLDEFHTVYECSYANLFWFKNNILYTKKDNVLPGITRNTIIKKSKFPVKFTNCTITDLYKMNEVFLTSSLRNIVPITKIDGHKIGNGKPGKNTITLSDELFSQIS